MKDRLFNAIWNTALELDNSRIYLKACKELCTLENDEISDETLLNIFSVAHLSVKDIVGSTKLNQKEFATHFCIPQRTVEAWCAGKRKCNDYIRLMMCKQLGML